MKSILLQIGLLVMGGSLHALALDGAVVIANSSVAADRLSEEELKNIYTDRTKYWDNGQAIIIVVPDNTDAALQQASGMGGSQFKTFWQRLAFSGRGSEPERVGDAAAVVVFVASTKGAIALVPMTTTLIGVKKIEIK